MDQKEEFDAPQIVAGMLSSCYTGEIVRLLIEPTVGWRCGTVVGFLAGIAVGLSAMKVVKVLEDIKHGSCERPTVRLSEEDEIAGPVTAADSC